MNMRWFLHTESDLRKNSLLKEFQGCRRLMILESREKIAEYCGPLIVSSDAYQVNMLTIFMHSVKLPHGEFEIYSRPIINAPIRQYAKRKQSIQILSRRESQPLLTSELVAPFSTATALSRLWDHLKSLIELLTNAFKLMAISLTMTSTVSLR